MPTDCVDPHRFDFDLDRGIREQVVEALEKSPLLPLKKGSARPIAESMPYTTKGSSFTLARRQGAQPRAAGRYELGSTSMWGKSAAARTSP